MNNLAIIEFVGGNTLPCDLDQNHDLPDCMELADSPYEYADWFQENERMAEEAWQAKEDARIECLGALYNAEGRQPRAIFEC